MHLSEQPASQELADHIRRVVALCRRVASLSGKKEITSAMLYACRDFDEACEYAAYEGAPLHAAITEFLAERTLPDLARLAPPAARPAVAGALPVMPAAASKLIRLDPEEASVSEVEVIAAKDPVLAGQLLSAANSAMYGRGAEIQGLGQAVMRLGVPLARQTMLAACFGSLFASAALKEIWKHSQVVAALAYQIAGECDGEPETAFLAGLLHDVGRLITQLYPAGLQGQVHDLMSGGLPLLYAETLIYGTDHASLGGELLRAWGLPAEIVHAVEFHHRPENTESALAGILCFAEQSARNGEADETLSPGLRRAHAIRIAGLGRATRGIERAPHTVFAKAG